MKVESCAAGALQEENAEVEHTPSDERRNIGNEEAMAAAVDHESAGYFARIERRMPISDKLIV
jgi:hypothetical protein